MTLFDLGALALKEEVVVTREGMKACQEYGRQFGAKAERLNVSVNIRGRVQGDGRKNIW